jgi:hypothetical protein
MGKIYSNYCVGEHFEGGETLGIAPKLTPANRGRILRNQREGWKRMSKERFCLRYGLTGHQVAAVLANTAKSKGGRKYRNKYINA